MKIVQINSACKLGSTGKIVAGISSLMRERGIDNRIFYSGNHKVDFDDGVQINHKLDIRIHQMLSRIFGDQGWHSYIATKRLIKEIDKFMPDLIHLHNIHGYYLHLPSLFRYLSKKNIPVIWTLHDCWAFTGHCTHFTVKKCMKWMTECEHCLQKSAYPYSWFFDRSRTLFRRKNSLYKKINNLTLTVVSHWLGEQVRQSKLLGDRPVYVVPNGIDTSVFKPGRILDEIKGVDIRSRNVILGVANNWSEAKGINDMLKLSTILPQDCMLVLVGLSQDQIGKLPEGIIGIGRTDNVKQLVDLYTTAMVYFNASMEETFGLTTLEAMACGTPAIVYKSTACPELINEHNGFAVNPHSLKEVLEKISEIKRKGKESFEKSCIEYTHTFQQRYIYERYLDLYKNEVINCDKHQNEVV